MLLRRPFWFSGHSPREKLSDWCGPRRTLSPGRRLPNTRGCTAKLWLRRRLRMQMTKTGHVSVSLNSIPLSFGKAVQTFFIPIHRGISTAAEHPPSMWEAALVLVGAIAVACFVLAPTAGLVVGIGCVVLWFVSVVSEVFRGRLEGILLWWVAALPLGGYFLSFPRENSILTLDLVPFPLTSLGLFPPNRL